MIGLLVNNMCRILLLYFAAKTRFNAHFFTRKKLQINGCRDERVGVLRIEERPLHICLGEPGWET